MPSSEFSRFVSSVSLRPVAACVALMLSSQAWAVTPFPLRDIRIEGLQRTDPGTVFAALPFRVGDTYNDDKGAAGLRALFATGLFKDVRIDIDGQTVVVIVEERAVIATVNFVGLKEFDKEQLLKSLKDAGIGEGQPFDKALVDRAEQEIKRQYLTRSLYGAEVVTTMTPLERNRVNVTFTMTEGDAAKISDIHIVGNKVFSESTLLSQFDLNPTNWLSWYTKGDRYSRAKLNADLETLRAYYVNRGYLEFNVESTQVAITPDKQKISVTLTVKEGLPYTVAGVKLEGEFLGKEEEFKRLILIKPGEAYRGDVVAATSKLLTERFAAYGYAFARAEARPEIDRATGQVVLAFVADPGRRVYVRRVNVAGNTRTRDEVVRREFRQFESAWYDGAKIKLSRDRVDRLGYFKDVTVDNVEVPGSNDQVDVVVNVTEKQTGNLMIGAGYSSLDKLSLTASIKQDNVFGSGNYLGVELNTGAYNRTLVVSSVDPYFTTDGISRAFDLAYRSSKPYNNQGVQYEYLTPSANVRFGLPVSDFDTVFVGIGAERTEIKGTGDGLPASLQLYVNQHGRATNSLPISVGWGRDERDSALSPTAGRYSRINVEWSPGGQTRYVRTMMAHQQYFALPAKFSLGVNVEVDWGTGLAGQAYPSFKNFYGGGLGSVRVFDNGSLGPVDMTGSYSGGSRKFNANAELYIPLPGAGNDKSLRMFAFADIGNVWGETRDSKNPFAWSSLRSSVGVGVNWISPMGPMKLSYGTPVRKQSGDRINRFQFQVGTGF